MKKVTKLGSKWNNSANAGAFYWNLNNASSNRNRNISRQLVNARNTPPFAGRGVLYICTKMSLENFSTRLVFIMFQLTKIILALVKELEIIQTFPF